MGILNNPRDRILKLEADKEWLKERIAELEKQRAEVRDFTESIRPISSCSTVGMIKSKLQAIVGDNDAD